MRSPAPGAYPPMPDEHPASHDPPHDPDFRTRDLAEPLTSGMKRFDIFLIDTGWNKPVSQAVRSQLHHLHKLHMQDTLYELTPEQSAEVLKHDPALIGHDPTIVVYDRYASAQAPTGGYRGFRLNLGLMRNAEQAMARLQEFVRFLTTHRTAEHLDREVRRELHREGIEGMVRVLREATVEMLIE